nr:zinc finger protein 782-like isoform X1 [Aedes albopictus]XP_029723574.1 zinc finger protein 782-like isoform X1 [Aedes albopictus]
MEHETFDLQAIKIEPLGEIDSIAESARSEHLLKQETAFEEEGSSYAEEQQESRRVNHIEEATTDRIEIGLVKIEEPADDDMEESAVLLNTELETNADQRDMHFELGLENAETATSRSNDSMHSKMVEVCEIRKNNVISDETNARRQGSVKPSNHRCDQCLKVFSTRLKLKDHMRMVHGEKKYACHICDKRFVLPNNLRVHARSHNEDTPFKCNVCEKTFKYEQSVWQHKKTQHVSQNSCVDCGIDFPASRYLRLHLMTHISDELEEESPQKEHEMLDLQAVKIEPLGEIDSIAASPRSEHSLEGETAFEDEVSSYGEEQEESQTKSHTEEATADSIEIGLVKIEEPADDDMEEDAVSQNAELEANADQRDLHFEVGLENAEPATSRSNDSMHSEMEEVCEVSKDINIISDETNVRRKKGTRNVKANSKIEDCGPREDKILEITQKKLQHRCNECSKVFSTSSN